MNKPVDFSTYKMVQKLSFNDFNKWVISIYNSGYQNAIDEQAEATELTDDDLLNIMLSVKGIGINRANEVIRKVLSHGIEA